MAFTASSFEGELHVFVDFRLRDEKEFDNVITSLSGHHGYKKSMEMYRIAVDDEKYSFMYADLLSNPPRFYVRFEKEMT